MKKKISCILVLLSIIIFAESFSASGITKVNKDDSNIEETTLDNAYVILSNFISENNAAENIFLAETVPPRIIIEMYTDYRTDERKKLIKDFMDQNGINDSDVMIEQYDFGWELGDANLDSTVNVRDCALIASSIASGKADSLPDTADYNKDGKKNVRDAAAISKDLASK